MQKNEILNALTESEIETYDASDMSVEDVLSQIELSMSQMSSDNKKRIIFTNDDETFEDVLNK